MALAKPSKCLLIVSCQLFQTRFSGVSGSIENKILYLYMYMLVLSCFLCLIIAYLAENTEIVATKDGPSQTFKMPIDCLLVCAKFFGSLS